MSEYTLTQQQHEEVSRLSNAGRTQARPAPPVPKPARYPGVCRVIAMETRVYDSTTLSRLPFFGYFPNRFIYTVEMVGGSLSGYVVLTINGQSFTLECRRENLDDVQSATANMLSAVVLPGLWEFQFDREAEIDLRPINSSEDADLCALFDDEDTVMFTGSVIIRRENWGTIPNADEVVARIDVVDAIPYEMGSVNAGAIGLAQWAWDAGMVVTGWQCRNFSFASGYVQAEDPAI